MSTDTLSHRDYFNIAIPFIVATVTQPLLGAVDTAVVGHLDSPIYIGGVAIGTVILNTLYWLFGFFRVSTTSQSAIALGSGDNKEIAASLVRPFLLALAVALSFILFHRAIWSIAEWIIAPEADVAEQARLYFYILIWGAPLVLLNYTVIGWLMGQAQTRATLITQVSGNVVNIILDIVLVCYFDCGVAGVAVASLLAQAGMLLLGLYYVMRVGSFSLKSGFASAHMTGEDIKKFISTNSDLLLRTVSLLIMFNLMAKVGASLGTTVLAGNAVLMQVTFITSYIFDGIANASSVFAGKSVGQGNKTLLTATFRRTNQWTLAAIILSGLLILTTGIKLGGLFSNIPEILEMYLQHYYWAAIFPVAAGFGLTYYGIFTGSGTTRPVRNATFFSLLSFITTLITVKYWGNHGLWFSFLIFYIGRGVYLIPYLNRIRSKVESTEKARQQMQGGNCRKSEVYQQ